MAKLKKFSNVILTAPVEKGNPFHFKCACYIYSIVNENNSPLVCVTNLEDENAEPAEATVATNTPEAKPSKSEEGKTALVKAGSPKGKAQANGTVPMATANIKSKSTGPKKAKVAKIDGEFVKGAEAKNRSADDKKEGKRFEKKHSKKKSPVKAKKRMGKNKFKKFKRMLKKQNVK